MLQLAKPQLSRVLFAIALLMAPIVQAKDGKKADPVPPPAPVPSQILSARKVFISNGGTRLQLWSSGGVDRPYNQLYAAMKDWGRYELVSAPADADLVLEIHGTFVVVEGPGRTFAAGELVLTFLDPNTHIALWTLIEDEGENDRQFDKAMNTLMQDLRHLVEPTSQVSTPAKRPAP